jgi:hypothetical protein
MKQKTVSTGELPLRLLEFTRVSLHWCAAESEKAVQTVMTSVANLSAKADRIAALPAESRQVLERLKATATESKASKDPSSWTSQLMDALEKLAKEESQVSDLINPIIESLQFQDRLQQNLATMHKLLSVWIRLRSEAQGRSLHRLDVGQALLDCASSVEEREIIRARFSDLPSEAPSIGRASMF